MTEHEKLLNGQEYDYKDQELQQMMGSARTLLADYNSTAFADGKKRSEILKEMLDIGCGDCNLISIGIFLIFLFSY